MFGFFIKQGIPITLTSITFGLGFQIPTIFIKLQERGPQQDGLVLPTITKTIDNLEVMEMKLNSLLKQLTQSQEISNTGGLSVMLVYDLGGNKPLKIV